ncbi:aspartate/glutamate racemase family protein [Nonomuraea jabiensis]|uniref:aspartate/glutamate racemase family protein n=1 Tax=Nonomuraea jabiensis TaxID=882448 RepID=UPI003D730073
MHLVDAIACSVVAVGITTVGLLATRFTMEMDSFYRDRMRRHGIHVVVPPEPNRTTVHDVIYQELTRGRAEGSSREEYRGIIAGLARRGAQGVILGCTEIALLVGPGDSPVPMFDSTRIHVETAVELALGAPSDPAGTAPR